MIIKGVKIAPAIFEIDTGIKTAVCVLSARGYLFIPPPQKKKSKQD